MMRTILTILLMFWNLENFFAPGQIPDKRWTAGQFYSKCNGVAKVMLMTDDRYGAPPDIAAFAEIGDSSVVRRLDVSPMKTPSHTIAGSATMGINDAQGR